jgi:kumamolisin
MSYSVPLPGSAFHLIDRPRPGHHRARPLTEWERRQPIELTLLLRERRDAPTVPQSLAWQQAAGARARHFEPSDAAARHDASPADRDRLAAWARSAGVPVTGENRPARHVTVRAPAARLGELFGVELERFRAPARDGASVEYRGHLGPVRVPGAIAGVVTGVYGLDDRPVAAPRLRGLDGERPGIVSYDPPEIAAAYAYPRLPGGGAGLHLVAGMIELGGVTHAADLAASFARLGLRAPEVINVDLDGALPASDPGGADLEVALDYQVLGAMVMAMAPKAQLTIVSYNAPNSERGFIDAVAAVASDGVRRPAAASISWGSPEDMWSRSGLAGMDSAFATGALCGLTYSAAAGDAGSTDAQGDGLQHPEFPASSPHVWACGGTTLLTTRGRILSETVWNELARGEGAAGSGVSGVFAPPEYQTRSGIHPRAADSGAPGRGLPDGSGVADPVTGWNVLAFGRLRTTGGTSAVAPMYTALWTLVAALQGRRLGLPHPALYAGGGLGFHDIVRGNTGGPYTAHRGWDTATGWGSPNGVVIARQLGTRAPGMRISSRSARERAALELG